MRSVAPRASSTSLPQLSQTRIVFRAIPGSLRNRARFANTPRAEQAQGRFFLGIEVDIPRADHAEPPGTEVLDRSSVQVLLDDGRTDVRRPRDGRRIPEPF